MSRTVYVMTLVNTREVGWEPIWQGAYRDQDEGERRALHEAYTIVRDWSGNVFRINGGDDPDPSDFHGVAEQMMHQHVMPDNNIRLWVEEVDLY